MFSRNICTFEMHVLLYIAAYIALLINFKKYKQSNVIVTSIIAMSACWDYIINDNIYRLEVYYYYSIIISMLSFDYLMVGHHILVLYTIYRVETPDRVLALTLLRYAKISDVVIYLNKICQYMNTTGNKIVEHIRMLSILITIVLWTIFRVGYVMYTVDKIATWEAAIAIAIFTVFNILWITKLCVLFRRLM